MERFAKIDYDNFLAGALTLKNGRIDKYQFDEGYCQAKRSNYLKDNFTFCYYDKDHLSNIRQVTEDDNSNTGLVTQIVNYYPFGMQLCTGPTTNNVQSHKYNGKARANESRESMYALLCRVQPRLDEVKEFDSMHGLNTYDYGARQYNPVTARWDRMDPLAHKYYSVSPYAYCMNNPVKFVDPDGMTDYKVNSYGQMYEATSILERVKSFFGYGCKQDRIFMEGSGKLIVSLAENSIQNLGKQEFVLHGKKIIQTSFTIAGNENANKVYDALTENTTVEWVAVEAGNNKMASKILTDHNSTDASSGINVLMDYERKTSSTIFRHNHFFTQDDYRGSEFERKARLRPSSYDMSAAQSHPKTTFYLDDKTNKQTLRYDGYKYWKVKKPY